MKINADLGYKNKYQNRNVLYKYEHMYNENIQFSSLPIVFYCVPNFKVYKHSIQTRYALSSVGLCEF
jgi:hypothetical protein